MRKWSWVRHEIVGQKHTKCKGEGGKQRGLTAKLGEWYIRGCGTSCECMQRGKTSTQTQDFDKASTLGARTNGEFET